MDGGDSYQADAERLRRYVKQLNGHGQEVDREEGMSMAENLDGLIAELSTAEAELRRCQSDERQATDARMDAAGAVVDARRAIDQYIIDRKKELTNG